MVPPSLYVWYAKNKPKIKINLERRGRRSIPQRNGKSNNVESKGPADKNSYTSSFHPLPRSRPSIDLITHFLIYMRRHSIKQKKKKEIENLTNIKKLMKKRED